jgi:hypothetical protein
VTPLSCPILLVPTQEKTPLNLRTCLQAWVQFESESKVQKGYSGLQFFLDLDPTVNPPYPNTQVLKEKNDCVWPLPV